MSKSSPFDRYKLSTSEATQRIVAASVGEAGTGKTSFWLGAPGPIVVQTLDQGLEGVVERFSSDKEIYVADYDLGQSGEAYTHALAEQARDKFVEDFEHAVKNARTIVWDRETDVFPLFSYARFGTDDAFGAAPPKDWDKLKGEIRRLIAMAKANDINFGVIQGMRNEWVSTRSKTGAKAATQSGNRIRAGMDDIDALVHIDLLHERKAGTFSVTVGKSRGPGGQDIQDQTFSNLSFVDFALLVFPDSTPEYWGA